MHFFRLNFTVKKSVSHLFFVFFLFFFISSIIFLINPSLTFADVEYPDYNSFVNDYVGVIDSNSKIQIEQLCIDVEKNTGAEIAVAVIDSLQGITIEEYAVKLFEKWGIGKAKEDNGVLLLIAIQDRKLRIEVGYGLEGAITDIEAGDIIDDVIVPRFKEGNYSLGIYEGIAAIANKIYEEYGQDTLIETGKTAGGQNIFAGFLDFLGGCKSFYFCCIPVFLIAFLVSGIRNLLRRKCPKCRKFKMKIKRTVIQEPTYTSDGKMLEERTCAYCGYHDQKIIKLPKKEKTSYGGFFAGGSGGFSGGGGGGFGGFGGGSSGGGGASGGW